MNRNVPILRLSCNPDNALSILVELEENETSDLFDNVHVILVDTNGEVYEYSNSSWEGPMEEASADGRVLFSFPYPQFPSNAPPETHVEVHVTFSKFTSHKGARIFIGLRPNRLAGFAEGAVVEAYKIP